MKTLISVKYQGVPPGQTFQVRAHEARILVGLGLAAYAPPPKPKAEPKPKATPKTYVRRDMVAEPVPQTVVSPSHGYAHPVKTPDDGKA